MDKMNILKNIITLSCLIFPLFCHAQTWSGVGLGIYEPSGGVVMTMKVINNKLYVGGGFSKAGGIMVNSIASWSGFQWDSVGNGFPSIGSGVMSIEEFNNEIYVGGGFSNGIKRWNGSSWNLIGDKIPSGTVRSLKYKGELYVGGSYPYLTDTNGNQTIARNISRWNGSQWNTLKGGVAASGPSSVHAMAEYKGELFVAGGFECIYNLGNFCDWSGYYNIARWNGTQWLKVDSGLNEMVFALEVDTVNNILYAGGNFLGTKPQQEGYVLMRFIGSWNGSEWSALQGDAFLPYAGITSLCIYNGHLYAGMYDITGTETDTVLARWDKKQWIKIDGPGSTIAALTIYQDDLYVGGYFQTVNGDSSMAYIARWHTPNYCDSVYASINTAQDTIKLQAGQALQPTSTSYANQWEWDFGDGTKDTAQSPTHSYDSGGIYMVKLRATFGFCPWKWDSVYVQAQGTGVEESEKVKGKREKLKVYPNPAGGSFVVEIESWKLGDGSGKLEDGSWKMGDRSWKLEDGSWKLEIYDVKGRLVKQSAIVNRQLTIETKGWVKGVYFVNLVEGGEVVGKEKVIVE